MNTSIARRVEFGDHRPKGVAHSIMFICYAIGGLLCAPDLQPLFFKNGPELHGDFRLLFLQAQIGHEQSDSRYGKLIGDLPYIPTLMALVGWLVGIELPSKRLFEECWDDRTRLVERDFDDVIGGEPLASLAQLLDSLDGYASVRINSAGKIGIDQLVFHIPYCIIVESGKTAMVRVGKHAAGHLLDGVEYHEFPMAGQQALLLEG